MVFDRLKRWCAALVENPASAGNVLQHRSDGSKLRMVRVTAERRRAVTEVNPTCDSGDSWMSIGDLQQILGFGNSGCSLHQHCCRNVVSPEKRSEIDRAEVAMNWCEGRC